ncbi:MAG: N(5)-(carboxyethyl)ornithine synthase [Clostridia bacterium]|nr:N(5)-(carboxyethyl)ornithine synthase [Clostridia bacterium]
MKTMGFVISHKNNERRRTVVPKDIEKNIKNKSQLYFEKGYGESLGISDKEYEDCGCHIVDRETALSCDIITDVKLGDAEYLESVKDGKILFGWAHAVQGIDFTSSVLKKKHTAIAWEEMYEDGRYILYRNREIAGESAILHAFRYSGKMPYDCKVAIIGNGQTAKGALRMLHGLGAQVDVYGRKFENLFKKKMYEYDVLVICVMWDTSRKDRIIYKEDLAKMKKGTLIIDVSCDHGLEIETSNPTTIDNPVYTVDGVIHYVVDNTPAMYPITVTNILSEELSKYIDQLIEDNYSDVLKKAIVINKGEIIDQRIKEFQNR